MRCGASNNHSTPFATFYCERLASNEQRNKRGRISPIKAGGVLPRPSATPSIAGYRGERISRRRLSEAK